METSKQTDALLDKVSELHHFYKHIVENVLHEFGLSASAINLIELIGEEKLTLKEITQSSRLDKSTISRQMNSLVKKEFVTKTTGKDKRFAYFTLTEKAFTVFENYHSHLEKQFSTILSGWTEEEIHMLTVLLGRLNRSISNRID